MIRHGDVGVAEAYRDGWWDSPDPTQLFLFGLQNQAALDNYIYGGVFGRIASKISSFFTRNTLKGSKKNIYSHYDIGNEFYRLWLDSTMTYSSGIFDDPSESLTLAQHKKYDRIIERIHASGNLLEIGCGWGGFVERALSKGDYRIKALTISKAQHDFAEKRVGQGMIALEDYRQQKGLYDQIVSIEMLEAVGEKFWPIYFSKIKSLLAAKGKVMIQTITIANDVFERYRISGDAIRKFIFPGGMLPSPLRFEEESAKAGLRITDQFNFGQSYALTISHWLNQFENKINEVKAMGFDNKFIRIWRFYMTCCIAAFQYGRTDVIQFELEHAS
jgi:cyclopropane-fatty-acyl-phospholipid synthase